MTGMLLMLLYELGICDVSRVEAEAMVAKLPWAGRRLGISWRTHTRP